MLPSWNELYGSGLRAASALASRGAKLTLHTGADQPTAAILRVVAASLRIATRITPVAVTPSFSYLHPLDEPVVMAAKKDGSSAGSETTIHVQAEKVLAFGMMEATPVVEASMVVYDPQAPVLPRPFKSSGSTARRLAVVANWQEAKALTGCVGVNESGRKLLADEGAEAVVIKDGPRGATVFVGETVHRVPAYQTRRTFSIGSGDVFSAVFAFGWMVEGLAPADAAEAASLATAWYCQTTNLPLPSTIPSDFHLGLRPAPETERRRRVYLAGPFFNLMQHLCVREVRACLIAQGLTVFSPFHDVGMAGSMAAIAQADLAGMDRCDVLFAILDGHDPGTVFEVGYARAKGMPVVILVGGLEPVNLTMFQGTGCHVFTDLVSAVYAAVWIERK